MVTKIRGSDNFDTAAISASKLTGDLPAINGSALTGNIGGRLLSHQIDVTQYGFTTSWGIGKTWDNITGITVGANVSLTYTIYARNDDSSWGGGFTSLFVSYDNAATWIELGSDGYASGNIMVASSFAIGQSTSNLIFENVTSGQIRFKFHHKAYSGSVQFNHVSSSQLGRTTSEDLPSVSEAIWARHNIIVKELS
jgi:hypothetical protein